MCTAFNESMVLRGKVFGSRFAPSGHESSSVPTQQKLSQQPCVERGFVGRNAGACELIAGARGVLVKGHAASQTTVASLSFSD